MIAQFFHFVYRGVRTYSYLPTYLFPKRSKKSTPYDENKELAETVARSPCYFFQQQLKQQKELATLIRALISPMPLVDTSRPRSEEVKSPGLHADSPHPTEESH